MSGTDDRIVNPGRTPRPRRKPAAVAASRPPASTTLHLGAGRWPWACRRARARLPRPGAAATLLPAAVRRAVPAARLPPRRAAALPAAVALAAGARSTLPLLLLVFKLLLGGGLSYPFDWLARSRPCSSSPLADTVDAEIPAALPDGVGGRARASATGT
ncbi:MAG: hypothetical protein MZW92_09535 [Comamonadaceae bacterium]|nr:hypothetical protein [Comamonadaceae bacterium]